MSYTLTYAPGGLASAADYIRSKGRGEDTRLMHVTEGELQSLQGLAMANGGSLTINPETGLPEAGFLKNILPTAAVAGAAIFGGPALGAALLPGASTALATGVGMGLISGLGTTLMTGDINKGLTAGATSGLLGGVGAKFAGANVDPTAVATGVPAAQAAKAAAANTAVNTSLNVPGASMMTNPSIVTAGAQPVASTASAGLLDKASNWWGGLSPNQKLGVGLGGVGAIGLLGGMSQPKLKGEEIDKGTIRPYTYQSTMAAPRPGQSSVFSRGPMYNAAGNPILDTEERNYFNQGFTPQPAYKAAAGGLMQGDMYPLSQQVNTQFANPIQAPTSAEVVGQYEPATLPFSGEPVRMRSGGAAEATREEAIQSALNNTYTYDPAKQQYTHVPPPPPPQPDPQTMFRSMFGGMGGKGMAGRNQPYMGMGGMNQGYQGMGGIGGMMGMLRGLERQATPVPIPSYQYTYDPVQQQYTQMAEGGNVTEGYKGYGQNNQGPMPINLLALMAPPEDNQQQQPVQVVRQAAGGLSTLGDYSDGGRLLKGPGDGVSDDIPAVIGSKQPARLADGEFVIPARFVSELGNGSTDAGAKRLYDWMDSMQELRGKTVGKDDVAKDTKAHKTLPV